MEDHVYEKIKEFSTLMHTLRHDLRNYIAAIEGYSYLLKEEYSEEYLNRIFSNISNINDLIDRSVLLADSDLSIENESEINLNSIIKSCQEIIPKEIILDVNSLPNVYGDYSKIYNVFKSIIHNAIVHGKPKNIIINGKEGKDGFFDIQIRNDGDPIPPEKASKLFYHIPQSLKPNTGISLLIVKKTLDAHHWKFEYNANFESETCFKIKIPVTSLVN